MKFKLNQTVQAFVDKKWRKAVIVKIYDIQLAVEVKTPAGSKRVLVSQRLVKVA